MEDVKPGYFFPLPIHSVRLVNPILARSHGPEKEVMPMADLIDMDVPEVTCQGMDQAGFFFFSFLYMAMGHNLWLHWGG